MPTQRRVPVGEGPAGWMQPGHFHPPPPSPHHGRAHARGGSRAGSYAGYSGSPQVPHVQRQRPLAHAHAHPTLTSLSPPPANGLRPPLPFHAVGGEGDEGEDSEPLLVEAPAVRGGAGELCLGSPLNRASDVANPWVGGSGLLVLERS